MIAYLSKNPFRIDSVGHNTFDAIQGSLGRIVAIKPLLLCDENFLHDGDEPISPDEIERINRYIGKKVVKKIRPWRKLTRIQAVEVIQKWIAKQPALQEQQEQPIKT